MSISAMYAASTAMKALDTKLSVVANNLANINTNGFKASRTNFEDLFYQIRREPGVRDTNDEATPHGIQVGLGVQVSGTQLDFSKGGIDQTNRKLDLTVDGEGFFQVRTVYNGQETIGYTRSGNFTNNANGDLTLTNSIGSLLEPVINIPDGANMESISIGLNGTVTALLDGATVPTELGQIELARFVNAEGLKQIGKNLYVPTDASGEPLLGEPLTEGRGGVLSGALEQSNVNPVRELVDLILTQRAFEMNSRSIESADEALRVISNLRT